MPDSQNVIKLICQMEISVILSMDCAKVVLIVVVL